MDSEGHPMPQSDSWTPSNLNLSAQGVIVEEARAECCAWSPSYLNFTPSEECVCPPGQPMLESPRGREQEMRPASSIRTIGEGDVQCNKGIQQASDQKPVCDCKKSLGGGEEQPFVPSTSPSKDRRREPSPSPSVRSPAPVVYIERCVDVCPGLCRGPEHGKENAQEDPNVWEGRSTSSRPQSVRGKSPTQSTLQQTPSQKTQRTQSAGLSEKENDAGEDIYIWEARSYIGSTDSEEMEKLRLAGKAPIPRAPGERSDEDISSESQQHGGVSDQQSKTSIKSSHTASSAKPVRSETAQDTPENENDTVEDVYIWEAKSYTGSADSDALEELRLAGKAPIPRGPGERSEGDFSSGPLEGPPGDLQEKGTVEERGPPPGQCYPRCPGACRTMSGDAPAQKPPSAMKQQAPSGDVSRKSCGCKQSTEDVRQPSETQRKSCECPLGTPGDDEKCVCKHCQKIREICRPCQPQWDYQLSAEPYDGPPYQPGDELKGSSDTPPEQKPDIAGKPEEHQPVPQKVPSPKPSCPAMVQEHPPPAQPAQPLHVVACTSSVHCYCKPTVHDRVEYLTNVLKEGISPLREALDQIERKMRAMGFGFGGEPPRPHAAHGGGGGGGGSFPPSGNESGGTRGITSGQRGVEPSVAIYIMSPGAAVPPNASQMYPPPTHPQIQQQPDQNLSHDIQQKASHTSRSSCKCITGSQKMQNLGTVAEEGEPDYGAPDGNNQQKVTLYYHQKQAPNSRGGPTDLGQRSSLCCQVPCCQHRPGTAQNANTNSKP